MKTEHPQLPGILAMKGEQGQGKSLADLCATGHRGFTVSPAQASVIDALGRLDGIPLEPGDCPKCGQNSWVANSGDGTLTVCDNCGWDVDADGYIEGRG